MIVFVGQVGGDMVDREAFQEVDYRRMFGSVAKWAAQIDRAERIPEYVAHAYRVAMSGRPGPVVLALPEDMLTSRAACADAPRVGALPPRTRARTTWRGRGRCSPARARRWCSSAAAAGTPTPAPRSRAFAEANALPVAARSATRTCSTTAIRNYAGDVGIGINPKLAARVRDADVLLVIGERLGEMTTGGYTLLDVAGAAADADPRPSGRRTNSAASTSPRSRSPRRRARSSPRINALPAAAPARPARGRRGRARRATTRGARRGRCPAPSTCGRSCAGSTSACPTTRSSPTAPATTRRGCTACIRYRGFARSSRPTPARWATACRPRSRAKAVHPRPHGASRGTATAAS